jgi:hypothetical protein
MKSLLCYFVLSRFVEKKVLINLLYFIVPAPFSLLLNSKDEKGGEMPFKKGN